MIFAVTDTVKVNPAKNSIQLKLQKAVLDSVCEKYEWDAMPLVPQDVSFDGFNIEDSKVHGRPCSMCGVQGGPRCVWLCCGNCACLNCAWLLYAVVSPFGVCPSCRCVFPSGWSVSDMLVAPPVEEEKLTEADVVKLRVTKRKEKQDFKAVFRKMAGYRKNL